MTPEHTFLLVGYSDEYVIMNDPYTEKRREFPISLFKERWESMGKQAVTVNKDTAGRVVVTKFTVPSEDIIQSVPDTPDTSIDDSNIKRTSIDKVIDDLFILIDSFSIKLQSLFEEGKVFKNQQVSGQ